VKSRSHVAMVAGVVSLPLIAVFAYSAAAARHAVVPATRTVLAQAVDPAGVEGRTLALSRVTIAPHTRLGLHRHPGTQIAYIQSVTLTYSVRTGVVNVYRGAADQNPQLVRKVTAGHTGKVFAGEWVIEQPSVIHFGANQRAKPLVILLATLFKNGAPASIPVTR
jgi:hypothetical protein